MFPICHPWGVFLCCPNSSWSLCGSGCWLRWRHCEEGTCPDNCICSTCSHCHSCWAVLSPWELGKKCSCRGEEPCNVILTYKQKITCICYCFHVYRVSRRDLGKKNLDSLRGDGRKKKKAASFGNGCLDLMQKLFWVKCLLLIPSYGSVSKDTLQICSLSKLHAKYTSTFSSPCPLKLVLSFALRFQFNT